MLPCSLVHSESRTITNECASRVFWQFMRHFVLGHQQQCKLKYFPRFISRTSFPSKTFQCQKYWMQCPHQDSKVQGAESQIHCKINFSQNLLVQNWSSKKICDTLADFRQNIDDGLLMLKIDHEIPVSGFFLFLNPKYNFKSV